MSNGSAIARVMGELQGVPWTIIGAGTRRNVGIQSRNRTFREEQEREGSRARQVLHRDSVYPKPNEVTREAHFLSVDPMIRYIQPP